jgi:DNA topoisomerase-6 subunit B
VEGIKPHPHGIELGQLQRMTSESTDSRMTVFLRMNFSGVSARASKELCQAAEIDEKTKPKSLNADQIRALLESFQGEREINGKPVKLLNPPTNCLSPIEELLIKKGLSKTIDSRFIATLTRAPAVTQGNPYQVEVGLIFGGKMPADKPVEILRFANRVPLMYQQGGCLLTKAIESVDWRQYGLDQPGAKGVPKGPAAILVHLASTNVQFTSEAKEALADNSEVIEEARKAMLEMGRGLRKHLEKKKKMAKTKEKFELINDILPAIAKKSADILGKPVPDLAGSITKIMSAVISETETVWNKETKQTDVSITLFNYTSRVRAYTILATWPEKSGATMVGNDTGGRKEATGVWAWKLESLQPGEKTVINYSLSDLERGDWTETDVFFRGAQDVIGASKMDEKFLDEIRRQERALKENEDENDAQTMLSEPIGEPAVAPPDGQTTLFGGDA